MCLISFCVLKSVVEAGLVERKLFSFKFYQIGEISYIEEEELNSKASSDRFVYAAAAAAIFNLICRLAGW